MYPRVVHLGFQPIGSPTNSGLTLASMFGEWQQARLLEVCLRPYPGVPSHPNVIFAPLSVAPVDGMIRTILGKRVPSGAVDGMNNSVSRLGTRLPFKIRLRVVATTINDIGPTRVPASTTRAISLFRPQAVHSLLGGVRAMRLALAVSEQYNIPIVPHFMDDWPDNLFADGRLWGIPRRAAVHDLTAVLRRTPVALTIGDEMRAEFQERFGIPCEVVGNSVDLVQYRPSIPPAPPSDRPTLRYVGGLHLGRDELIGRVAVAMAAQQPTQNPWTIELYIPDSDSPIGRRLDALHPNVTYRGSLAPDDVPAALTSATAQLFVESSDPSIARFTRLSVSTKVPQYVAANRPVLVFGDEDQGSVRALLQSGLGVYAGTRVDKSLLAAALVRLEEAARESRSAPSDLGIFDIHATRRRLHSAVVKAIAEWRCR